MASSNNIERLREARAWKRPELARRMNTSPQQLERLEKGQRKLSQEWIDRAAEALGVEPAEIIATRSDTGPISLPDLPSVIRSESDTVELIRLDLSVSMGPGTIIDDYVEASTIKFDLGFLREITRSQPPLLRIIDGIGDSMYPTLNPGDVIIVDTGDRMLSRQDGIYWISVYGASGLKRLRAVGPSRVKIVSDNPGVEDYEVDADDLRIEGRVVWYARRA